MYFKPLILKCLSCITIQNVLVQLKMIFSTKLLNLQFHENMYLEFNYAECDINSANFQQVKSFTYSDVWYCSNVTSHSLEIFCRVASDLILTLTEKQKLEHKVAP